MTREPASPSLVLLLSAFGAFAAANVIHNAFGVDPAIAPPSLFVGLYVWRRRLVLLLAAAFVIALPSFSFLRPSELSSPTTPLSFANHVALLAAGLLAVACAATALLARRRAALPS
jgi:hypothetical protein